MLIAHILNEKGGDIYTVHDFDLMERVCHELHAKRVGALVVVDHAGAIAGVISERDIVRESPGAAAASSRNPLRPHDPQCRHRRAERHGR
jgi:CBS domain.